MLFVINSLGSGGAERVLETILRATPRDVWEPHLVLLDDEMAWREMPDWLPRVQLNCRGGLTQSIRALVSVVRKMKPDLAVSFLVRANVANAIASRMTGVRSILSERMHLSAHLSGKYTGPRLAMARLAPRLAYMYAHQIIAVAEGVRSDLVSTFGVRPERVLTIHNPYNLERIVEDATAPPEFSLPPRFILGAGRLTPSKGFAELISAYGASELEEPLCILGEGAERPRLEAHISALGLNSRVHLLGYAANPFAIMARASLFVSSSKCEGFPNALAEAMVLGVPVVATDCRSGPAEILEGIEKADCLEPLEATYGVLSPENSIPMLTRSLNLMVSSERRARYASLGRRRMADFRMEKIARRYWDTFATACGR